MSIIIPTCLSAVFVAFADHPYKARLCYLKIWPSFQGYGFNLHAEKNKPGQYIGKVDVGSPAEAAGLKEGDKIIEVNGENISTSNHQGVVQKIKAEPNQTRLLVLDAEALHYFEQKGISVSSSSPFVESITCPDSSQGLFPLSTLQHHVILSPVPFLYHTLSSACALTCVFT